MLARVVGNGGADGAGGGLEARLGDVVTVATVVQLDVEINQGIGGNRLPEVIHELRIEFADLLCGKFQIADVPGSAGEMGRDGDEGFLHGEREAAVTDNPLLVTPSLGEGLPETDTDVFDSVVLIDLQVSFGSDVEVDETVTGEEGEHVVEKADAGIDPGGTGTVQIETEFDLGFGGLAADGGGTGHRSARNWGNTIDSTIITPERVRAKSGRRVRAVWESGGESCADYACGRVVRT